MKVLEELFYGNISVNERSIAENKQLKEAMQLVDKNEEKFLSMLSDKQKEQFEKYKESHNEMTTIWEKIVFTDGYSLGSRMAYESMNNDGFVV